MSRPAEPGVFLGEINLTAPKVKVNRFSAEDTGGLDQGYETGSD